MVSSPEEENNNKNCTSTKSEYDVRMRFCRLSIEEREIEGGSRERVISFFVHKLRINECLLSPLGFFLVYVRLKEDEDQEEIEREKKAVEG